MKEGGRWYVTVECLKARKQYKDAFEFTKRSAELYQSWKKGQPAQPAEPADEAGEVVEGSAVIALEAAGEQALV